MADATSTLMWIALSVVGSCVLIQVCDLIVECVNKCIQADQDYMVDYNSVPTPYLIL